MYSVITDSQDEYGRYQIMRNNLTMRRFKRIAVVRRGKLIWSDWYAWEF